MTGSNIQPDDYISFAGLRLFLTGFIRLFFHGCKLLEDAVRRHYWMLAGWTLAGGLAGWLYHSTFGGKYKVAMIVEYRVLDKTIYRNIVNDINRMILYGSRQQAAAKLGIPPYLVEKVNKIGTTDLNGKPLVDDPTSRYPIFQITGELRSPGGEDSLGEALIDYINHLPYLQSEITEQSNIRKDQLSYIGKEMASLDSLHPNILSDPSAVYRQSYTLDSLRTAVRTYLIHGDKALSPITAFKAPDRPQSAPAMVLVAAFAMIGFLIAFLIAVLMELKTRVR